MFIISPLHYFSSDKLKKLGYFIVFSENQEFVKIDSNGFYGEQVRGNGCNRIKQGIKLRNEIY